MPELNGIELLSQVKSDANLRAVPVVSECRRRRRCLPPRPSKCCRHAGAPSHMRLHPSLVAALLPCCSRRTTAARPPAAPPTPRCRLLPAPRAPAVMSSVDQEETVAECVQYGAEEYLVKPVRWGLGLRLGAWGRACCCACVSHGCGARAAVACRLPAVAPGACASECWFDRPLPAPAPRR